MGRASGKKKRRLEFFTAHPHCCFCGGSASATTEDHFPSRGYFRHRAWPEGYVFPACTDCNKATAEDEAIVAFLSLVRPSNENPAYQGRIVELMRAMQKFHPGLLERMNAGVNQQQYPMLDALGFITPPGQDLPRAPLLSVSDPAVQDAVMNFARKLALALYYKHIGEVLPGTGFLTVRWYSNVQIEKGEIPRDLAAATPLLPKLERSGGTLNDQFFYRWGAGSNEGRNFGVFVSFFHTSFAIVGFVGNDPRTIDSMGAQVSKPWRRYAPYAWPEARSSGAS